MTQKKALVDMLLDAGLVLTFGLVFIQLLEKVDKLETKVGALESSDTWEKAELARMHRNQDELARVVFQPAETKAAKEPVKKAVGRPRKTTAAKKTTARKPALA